MKRMFREEILPTRILYGFTASAWNNEYDYFLVLYIKREKKTSLGLL